MSLDLNTESYVTVEEANSLIANYFTSTNPLRTKWSGLSDSDKESLLRHSCRAINSLKLDGKRKFPGQVLEFPREKSGVCGVGYRLFVSQYGDNSLNGSTPADGGLSEAKLAQTVNACYGCYFDSASLEQIGNNIKGLTSKKVGPIAETYYNPQSNTYNRDVQKGIYTKEVYSILVSWVCESRLGL